MDKQNPVLSKHLQGKYELVGILPGEIIFKKKKYDFRTATEAEAKELIQTGCTLIKELTKAAPKDK